MSPTRKNTALLFYFLSKAVKNCCFKNLVVYFFSRYIIKQKDSYLWRHQTKGSRKISFYYTDYLNSSCIAKTKHILTFFNGENHYKYRYLATNKNFRMLQIF